MHFEGQTADDWKLVDVGNFVVHFFTPESRQHYDLEGLWSRVELDASGMPQLRQPEIDDSKKIPE
jgi:ribosomal silencing factor RsfS